MRLLALLLIALAAPASSAFVEVGASANYRSSGYDKSNYVESIAYTASLLLFLGNVRMGAQLHHRLL